jgi:hypothetical protein
MKQSPVSETDTQPVKKFPALQIYNSASDCLGFGNIPGSHFVEDFSALPSHFIDVSSITKAPSLQC